MGHVRPAMRDEFFKYRKRKHRSLGGRVPGIPPATGRAYATPQGRCRSATAAPTAPAHPTSTRHRVSSTRFLRPSTGRRCPGLSACLKGQRRRSGPSPAPVPLPGH